MGHPVRVDPEIRDLVPGYLERRAREVEQLRSALDAGELDAVAAIGHRLKGSGAGYGMPHVSELGAALYRDARGGDVAAARTTVERLAAYLDDVELDPSEESVPAERRAP